MDPVKTHAGRPMLKKMKEKECEFKGSLGYALGTRGGVRWWSACLVHRSHGFGAKHRLKRWL